MQAALTLRTSAFLGTSLHHSSHHHVAPRRVVLCSVKEKPAKGDTSRTHATQKPQGKVTPNQGTPQNKMVQPPTIGDRLQNGVTNVLNVVAIPAGLMLLGIILPAIWAYRLYEGWTMKPVDVKDKVVLVTGASSGVGEYIAYEYARLGAKLALVARREEKLNDVAKEARTMGCPDVTVIVSDLGNEEGCKKAIDGTIQHFGSLDVLVCNAGTFMSWYFPDAKETEGFRSFMDVNFWNHVYMTHYALPYLKKAKGQIVFHSSMGSIIPQPRNSLYNAAKAAADQFYHTLRIELKGCVAITVLPTGVTKAELADGKMTKPSGYLPNKKEAKKLRNEQLALYPMLPTPVVAEAIVRSSLLRKEFAIIPPWYQVFLFYRYLAPEILDNFLRFLLVREKTVAKTVIDTFDVKVGQPTEEDYRESAIPDENEPPKPS